MSVSMVYTDFVKDLTEYLEGKLPDIPVTTAQEIGAHIGNKVIILVQDMMLEYDRVFKFKISKGTRQYTYRSCESRKENTDGNCEAVRSMP